MNSWLDAAARGQKGEWINLQGPGFDDAYRFRQKGREHSPRLQEVARRWFESTYPVPSRFESVASLK